MNAEFDWWLLVVGLVVGGGLVWFVLLDSRRRDADVDREERTREAAWLSAMLAQEGRTVPPDAVERLLRLHSDYLEAPPPDEVPTGTQAPIAPSGPPGEDDLGVRAGSADIDE